jgi:hypothetical protein
LAVDLEAAAAGIGQRDAGTQKFHVYPQVPQLVTRYVRA